MFEAQELMWLMSRMVYEMEANQHKATREQWSKLDPKILLADCAYHLGKLASAIGDGDPEKADEYVADIANMALMCRIAYKNHLEKEDPPPLLVS